MATLEDLRDDFKIRILHQRKRILFRSDIHASPGGLIEQHPSDSEIPISIGELRDFGWVFASLKGFGSFYRDRDRRAGRMNNYGIYAEGSEELKMANAKPLEYLPDFVEISYVKHPSRIGSVKFRIYVQDRLGHKGQPKETNWVPLNRKVSLGAR